MAFDMEIQDRRTHDEMCEDVSKCIHILPEAWEDEGGKFSPFAVVWTRRPVATREGNQLLGGVLVELSDNEEDWGKQLLYAVDRLGGRAVFLARCDHQGIKALLETHGGTRRWRYKKEHRGDIYRLGEPTVEDNVESLGLFYDLKAS